MFLQNYLNELNYDDMPSFFYKYLNSPSLNRLKNVGYFCGMDYASKNVYNFSERITRFDHSLTVCLLVYKLTNDKASSLRGLFHDIATPCFSHVIDYMNNDYEKQESTEEFTEYIIKNDLYLMKSFMEDGINPNEIIDFKSDTIVDNDRPKVCADRIDGVILTGACWTKDIDKYDMKEIVRDLSIFANEYGEKEIGFSSLGTALKVAMFSNNIDLYCHSSEDNYMMELLSKIADYSIKKGYIKYNDLFVLNENEVFNILKNSNDLILEKLIFEFENKKRKDIPCTDISNVKKRSLKPIVNGIRI